MIKILQEQLNTALDIVKQGLPGSHSVLPILKNALIDFGTDGMVTLTTNDLETIVQYQIGCKAEGKPFATCVPCKVLSEAVDLFHDDIVEVWQWKKEKQLMTSFKCNNQTLNFNSNDPADYPPVPKVEGQSIELYDLADTIKKVKDLITDTKGSRYNHQTTEGLLFDFDKGLIVATDRNRMKVTHLNTTQNGLKFRISKKAATLLLKCKDTVKITYQPEADKRSAMVKFESGNMTIIALDLESKYKFPDYQSIMAKEENKELVTIY